MLIWGHPEVAASRAAHEISQVRVFS